jgi:hypothetical protein
MPGVKPGQETASRRGANSRTRIELREPYPHPCQLIDIRRFNFLLAINANIAITQVIGENEDYVGTLVAFLSL